MKIVIEAEYPQVLGAFDFIKSIAESSDHILKHVPEGSCLNFDNDQEGVKIKISL